MVTIDREAMRQRLETWLQGKIAGARDLRLSPPRFPRGTGNSAETTFADLSYSLDGARQEKAVVFRRQLEGTDLFFNASLELPYRTMEALAMHDAIPAPKAIGLEMDRGLIGSPFLAMEGVEGRIVDQVPNYNLEGWVADLAPEKRREVWLNAIETLATFHKLDWREGFQFLDDPARGRPGLDQYLDWVRDWYLWGRRDRPLPVADAALAWLYDNQPADTEISVLWGDPTPANTLFAPDLSVAAILDFEMVAMGPSEVDLAWWFMAEENFSTASGIARLEGLPSRAETIAFYEKVRGRPVANMDYYDMLAHFRANIVSMRFSDRLVSEGRMPDGTDVLTHNPATANMAKILGLEPPTPGEGVILMGRGMAGAS